MKSWIDGSLYFEGREEKYIRALLWGSTRSSTPTVPRTSAVRLPDVFGLLHYSVQSEARKLLEVAHFIVIDGLPGARRNYYHSMVWCAGQHKRQATNARLYIIVLREGFRNFEFGLSSFSSMKIFPNACASTSCVKENRTDLLNLLSIHPRSGVVGVVQYCCTGLGLKLYRLCAGVCTKYSILYIMCTDFLFLFFIFYFFLCSADHERDWPPCKVVF